MNNHVFLSYRSHSREHSEAVRRLGEILRKANLPVYLDQFYLDEHPGGPNEGWPKWCEDAANHSACVLIIASDGWFEAYDGTAPKMEGRGAATEAAIIRMSLYDSKWVSDRFRLAFVDEADRTKIPTALRPWHQFEPFAENSKLNQMVEWIAKCLRLPDQDLPSIQWPRPVNFQPDLADRIETEWKAVVDLLSGNTPKRILLLQGESGLGKSELIRQGILYARTTNIPIAHIDFKCGTLDVQGILAQLDLDLAPHLPEFHSKKDSHVLRKAMRGLRRPVLIVFDSYEDVALNPEITNWLKHHLLPEIESSALVAVIIGGKNVPAHSDTIWRDLVNHIILKPIDQTEHWESWIERKVPGFKVKGAHLPTILMAAKGNPAVIVNMCKCVAESTLQS
jgi:hypothetical protein